VQTELGPDYKYAAASACVFASDGLSSGYWRTGIVIPQQDEREHADIVRVSLLILFACLVRPKEETCTQGFRFQHECTILCFLNAHVHLFPVDVADCSAAFFSVSASSTDIAAHSCFSISANSIITAARTGIVFSFLADCLVGRSRAPVDNSTVSSILVLGKRGFE
jgi:hypothetical protein